MTYPIRTSLTLALAGSTAALALMPCPLQMLQLGRAAALQFDPSDDAYLRSAAEMAVWSHPGLGAGAALALLAAIWWRPLRGLLVQPVLLLAAVAGAATLLGQCGPAAAYYNKQDYAEPYLIYMQWCDSCLKVSGGGSHHAQGHQGD